MKYEFFITCTLNPDKALLHILNAMYQQDKHFKITFLDIQNTTITHQNFIYNDESFLVFNGVDIINNFKEVYPSIHINPKDNSIGFALFDDFDSYVNAFDKDFVYRKGHYFYLIHFYFHHKKPIFEQTYNDFPLDNFVWLDNHFQIDVCTIIQDYNEIEVKKAVRIFKD